MTGAAGARAPRRSPSMIGALARAVFLPTVRGARGAWRDQGPRDHRKTTTFERVRHGKVEHGSHQVPASGDTNSRKWLQVAGVQGVPVAPLDQESPGSSPGGATGRSETTCLVSGLFVLRPAFFRRCCDSASQWHIALPKSRACPPGARAKSHP
jgi:hypothetical protein